MNQMVDAFQKACYIEMLRGTPPPTWEQTCLNLEKKLADSRQHVTELEGRLRALWDKLEGERKYYEDRIKRLEDVGDKMEIYCDTILARDWKEAKEAKP